MSKSSIFTTGLIKIAHSKKLHLAVPFTAIFALALAVPMFIAGCMDPPIASEPDLRSPAGITITGPVVVVKGSTGQFQAKVTNPDGTPLDPSYQVTWAVVKGPGEISPDGVYTAPTDLTTNTIVTLQATVDNGEQTLVAERDLLITPATLTELTILGPEEILAGQTVNFTAQADFGNRMEDVTPQAEWTLVGPGTLDDKGIYTAPATLDADTEITLTAKYTDPNSMDVEDLGILAGNYGTDGNATLGMGDFNGDGNVDIGDLGILAANYNVNRTTDKKVPVKPSKTIKRLINLTLDGPEALPQGGVGSYTATAYYNDGTSQEVTAKATWSIAGGPGTISSNSYTAPAEVSIDTPVTLQTSYTENGTTKSVQKPITVVGLTVTPAALTWDASDTSEKTITLAGTGSTVLEYTISEVPSWLSIPALAGSTDLYGRDVAVILGDRASLNPGEYKATMKITPKIGSISGTARSVTVTLLVAAISVNAETLTFAPGDTALPVEVWNSGAGTLIYSVSGDTPWLSISPAGGTSTGEHDTLTVSVDRTGLDSAQTYSGVLTVSSTQPGVTSKTVSITLAAAQSPIANAGPDRTVTDSDGNGFETVSLDGSGSSSPNGSIINYRWTEGETTLADSASPKVNVTLPVGVHTLTLTVTDNFGVPSSPDTVVITITPPAPTELLAPYSEHPVTIDGSFAADEWTDAQTYTLDGSDTIAPGIIVAGNTAGTSDTSAKVYLKHDANYIYIAVEVTDDVIVGTASYPWEADCVELFLDQDNSRTATIGLNRWQFDVDAGGHTIATSVVPANSWDGAAGPRTGGYVVEYRLNKSALGLAASGTYGFDIAISDVEPAAGTIETRYWFFSASDASGDESQWGKLTLEAFAPTPQPGTLSITPTNGLNSMGNVGGPFTPASQQYLLSNTGGTSIDWTASKTQNWVTLSKTGGTLEPGTSENITVSVNTNANALTDGTYNDTVTFTNTTNGNGNTSRPISLSVNPAEGTTMTAASRISGVAPLAVFFDAVNTTDPAWNSGVVQPTNGDYTSFHYEWDFGDSASGTWATNGRSKNKATGYVAAHVFETPGTYRVSLTVTDTSGQKHTYTQDITVQDFTGTTYYVSSSEGNDTNNGLSPGTPFQSFSKAMSMIKTNTRILFKRGDSWTINSTYSASVNGPVILADYGSGNLPILMASSSVDTGSLISVPRKDWRFKNLKIIHNYVKGSSSGGMGILMGLGNEHCLVSGLDFTKTGSTALYPESSRYAVLSECSITDTRSTALYMQKTTGIAVLGCNMYDMPLSHNIYAVSIRKGIFSHNKLTNASQGHSLRICGQYYPSEYNIVSCNIVDARNWISLHFGPNNGDVHEFVDNLLVDSNYIFNTDVPISVESGFSKVKITNNIVTGRVWLRKNTRTDDPDPMDVLIMNNTMINSANDAVIKVECVNHKNITIKNNIIYHNGTAGSYAACLQVVDINGMNQIEADYNLYHAPALTYINRIGSSSTYTLAAWKSLGYDMHSLNGDPTFMNLEGFDFRLNAESPAIDAGLPIINVLRDFDNNPRPQGMTSDIGAYEYYD